MALKSDIYFRRADRSDIDVMVAWMEDPAFVHFIYGDPVRTSKQIRRQLVGMLGRGLPNTMSTHMHLIVERPGSGPLGMITIGGISWRNRNCSMDVYLVEKARNHITGFVASTRAVEYCFTELNMHRINIFIYAFNPRSWRLFEMSGSKRELELKEHVARDGDLLEMYGYGLLRSEWEPWRDRVYKQFAGIELRTMVAQRRESLRHEAVQG